MAACLQPGMSLSAVSLANGLNPNMVRKWVGSFYLPREEGAALREQMKGVQPVHKFPHPPRTYQEQGFESDMYGSLS